MVLTQTLGIGKWVDRPSDQAHQTQIGSARGLELDDAVSGAATAAGKGPLGGLVSGGGERN